MRTHSLFALIIAAGLAACTNSSPTDPGDTDTTGQGGGPAQRIQDSLKVPEARGEFVDPRDGRRYGWVQIGFRRIFTSNLAYKPRHGKTFVYTADGLDSAASIAKYGLAYDYEAFMDSTQPQDFTGFLQGACPDGWRIPRIADWEVIASRPLLIQALGNPVVDSIFNHWSFVREEGGTNSLELSFRQGWGTDYDCDTALVYADSISNCRETHRMVAAYAVADTFNHQADIYDRIITPAPPAEERRYNVYRLANSSVKEFHTRVNYGNSVMRRRFTDFSFVRCVQFVNQ